MLGSPTTEKMPLKAKTKKGLNPEDFKEGDWVVAHLTRHPLKDDNGFFAEISEKSLTPMTRLHLGG